MDKKILFNLQLDVENKTKLLNRYRNLIIMISSELEEHVECIKTLVHTTFIDDLEQLNQEIINFNLKYSTI